MVEEQIVETLVLLVVQQIVVLAVVHAAAVETDRQIVVQIAVVSAGLPKAD